MHTACQVWNGVALGRAATSPHDRVRRTEQGEVDGMGGAHRRFFAGADGVDPRIEQGEAIEDRLDPDGAERVDARTGALGVRDIAVFGNGSGLFAL